jgi:hypothetical protein
MSNAPENNEEFQDREFERAVYQAMKSCGWLLPKSPEELRRAEAKLVMNPIELPESLRDPFQILDTPQTHSRDEYAVPSVLLQLEGLQVPAGLQRLASEVGLRLDQVMALISMQAQIIANRSTSRNEEPEYEDWKRLYDSVKEFL